MVGVGGRKKNKRGRLEMGCVLNLAIRGLMRRCPVFCGSCWIATPLVRLVCIMSVCL